VDDPGDLDMYLALAATTDGPILELAAGSGRICVPLAAAGHSVTAVDRDAHMLARARRAWNERRGSAGGGSLEMVKADITDLDLGRQFDLVILALSTFLLLPGRAAQQAVLRTVARHLAPATRVAIDVWLPTPDDLALYDGRVVLDWVRQDESTGEWVAKTTSARYEPATQIAHVRSFFDAWHDGGQPRRTARHDEVHFVGYSELLTLLDAAGIQVETAAGDYELSPFSGSAERIVVIGRMGRAGRGRAVRD
jgi:SAM-dependent methyltransferase